MSGSIIPEKLPVNKNNSKFITIAVEAIMPDGSVYTKTLQSEVDIYRALPMEEIAAHLRETLIDPFVVGAKERLK